ncbi:neutral zinc metallopeptidase [Candidatus Saccharibacteria bacterium]|nr:neutral zinc metallopeptidase [Candidatus Saccharibacteria bacterium]
MAYWDKITSRGNVEDRRSLGPGLIGGGLGALGIIISLAVSLLGGDPAVVQNALEQLQTVPGQSQQAESGEFAGEDSYETFATKVLGSNNELWNGIFSRNNLSYQEPRLVLFRGATSSGCGAATSAVGPHYCPADQTIYLDETFFDELKNRFGASGGDVAEAYVIAHEVGHHVQQQLGVMQEVQAAGNSNEQSVRLELQADCFAGIWSRSVAKAGVLEPGEIREAIDAAEAVGDDRIQQKTQGQVSPETWTHGSSEQRATWFNRGYDSGAPTSCNTFE